jgi:hypothetical protein
MDVEEIDWADFDFDELSTPGLRCEKANVGLFYELLRPRDTREVKAYLSHSCSFLCTSRGRFLRCHLVYCLLLWSIND